MMRHLNFFFIPFLLYIFWEHLEFTHFIGHCHLGYQSTKNAQRTSAEQPQAYFSQLGTYQEPQHASSTGSGSLA